MAHAFTERFDLFIGVGEEVESFEPAVDGWVGLAEPAELGEELEVFTDLHAAVEAAFLGEVTDSVAAIGGGGGAEQPDTAAIGQEDIEHHPERGGFSGSVGADEAVDGALGDFEAELVDGEFVSEAFGDLGDFGGEHGRRGIPYSPRGWGSGQMSGEGREESVERGASVGVLDFGDADGLPWAEVFELAPV